MYIMYVLPSDFAGLHVCRHVGLSAVDLCKLRLPFRANRTKAMGLGSYIKGYRICIMFNKIVCMGHPGQFG